MEATATKTRHYIRRCGRPALYMTRDGRWTHNYEWRQSFDSQDEAEDFATMLTQDALPGDTFGIFPDGHRVDEIDFDHCCEEPTALVLLPWAEGITIAKHNASGKVYGCRDVTKGPGSADIVCSWLKGARQDGLEIEDRTPLAWWCELALW